MINLWNAFWGKQERKSYKIILGMRVYVLDFLQFCLWIFEYHFYQLIQAWNAWRFVFQESLKVQPIMRAIRHDDRVPLFSKA